MKAKETLQKIGRKITPAYITKVALLTGISYILYMFVKVKLPFMFPSFLEMQISELPAILAGFSLDPVAGALVIVFKCLLKFPSTSTAFVGEITDMILGVLFVLPASILYHVKKSKKNALLGLIGSTVLTTIAAMLLNRFVSVPFYVEYFFGGNFGAIVGMCSVLYPDLTENNFYLVYLFVGVLPFNILRLSLVSALTFLVYKRLSKALHWEFTKNTTPNAEANKQNTEANKEQPESEAEQTETDETEPTAECKK